MVFIEFNLIEGYMYITSISQLRHLKFNRKHL